MQRDFLISSWIQRGYVECFFKDTPSLCQRSILLRLHDHETIHYVVATRVGLVGWRAYFNRFSSSLDPPHWKSRLLRSLTRDRIEVLVAGVFNNVCYYSIEKKLVLYPSEFQVWCIELDRGHRIQWSPSTIRSFLRDICDQCDFVVSLLHKMDRSMLEKIIHIVLICSSSDEYQCIIIHVYCFHERTIKGNILAFRKTLFENEETNYVSDQNLLMSIQVNYRMNSLNDCKLKSAISHSVITYLFAIM